MAKVVRVNYFIQPSQNFQYLLLKRCSIKQQLCENIVPPLNKSILFEIQSFFYFAGMGDYCTAVVGQMIHPRQKDGTMSGCLTQDNYLMSLLVNQGGELTSSTTIFCVCSKSLLLLKLSDIGTFGQVIVLQSKTAGCVM